ncbi:MAG: hypothetical protein ACYTFY_08485 [Planctomycetota bacterium]|jgi:hypothetical protein
MKKYMSIFDPDNNNEESLWHGRPYGEHAFGCIHHVPTESDGKNIDIVTTAISSDEKNDSEIDEYEIRHWPRHHWPAVTHSTIYAVSYDILNCWFENSKITKEDYVRTNINWAPDKLDVTWKAKDISIRIEISQRDCDTAVFRISITNNSRDKVAGSLKLSGDANKFNYNASYQSWGKCHTDWQWHNNTVVVDKTIEWGMGLDFFPFHTILKPEDSDFDWMPMYYELAMNVEGNNWLKDKYNTYTGFETWLLSQEIELAAAETLTFSIGLAAKWHAGKKPSASYGEGLAAEAENVLNNTTLDSAAADNRKLWTDFFEKVPALKDDWPEDLVRLYYKAWTSVFFNTIPPADMMFYKSKVNMGVCCKIAPSTMATCPAAWESSLSALCLSLVKPKLACEIIESIYQTTQEDGFISELLGGIRITQLAVNEPFTAWVCYQASKDKNFLERIYPNLLKNLYYRTWHPTWKHHGTMMLRNMSYAHISSKYTKKIAEVLERPADEIQKINKLIDQTEKGVHAFWNEKEGFYNANFNPIEGPLTGGKFEEGCDGETLIPVFRTARKEVMPQLLDLIEKEFVTKNGTVRRKAKTKSKTKSGTWNAKDEQNTFTLKESNLMFVYKGIKDSDRVLFERIVDGTVKNIRKAGDFFECYDLDGLGRHNGPGSIFGAFAVIWGMLLKEDQVDFLYD